MSKSELFDILYKIVSLLLTAGILGGILRLVLWAIRLEPRMELIEKETASHGSLIQQLTATVSRIEGWLGAFQEWDGRTERRNKPKDP
jgi:hypothetical protein